ncbi:MAG: hypothetical protein ASARMPRED_000915 [Alectoria sarmentosa]|nr:MAG: hypothetical protein ASARMPRED_000915 [Alectoria sarmentosa]
MDHRRFLTPSIPSRIASHCELEDWVSLSKTCPALEKAFLPIVHGHGFTKLPMEMMIWIMKLCPRNDLLSVGRTSSCLNSISNTILYRHVDLSIHNRGQVKIRPTDGFTQSSDSYWSTQVPADSLLRQESFITAILGNPRLATLVRSLTWTLLRPHTKELGQNVLLGITPRRAILRIWDVFQRLTGVRTLDLAWLSRDHGDPLADGYPNGLFPAAVSIRLSGVMHYSFAASILHNNPAKLEHLTLDNLQQVGKGCDHFLYRRANQRQDHQQQPSSWNHNIQQYGPLNSFSPAGPMQNLFGSLTGLCSNLRRLTIRKVGQRGQTEFTPVFSAKDIDMYFELATFIYSVKGTLRHFVFEQGERTAPPPPLTGNQIVIVVPPRPMDTRFDKILVFPLILAPWQCLESMTLGGVHISWPDDGPTFNNLGRDDIKAVTRRDVEVMDHIGLSDPLAGVIR